MNMVKQLALRSVHNMSELRQHIKIFFFFNCFTWSPAKLIINNNAKVPVLMNLFNVTVFKTKIKVKREKLFLPSSK